MQVNQDLHPHKKAVMKSNFLNKNKQSIKEQSLLYHPNKNMLHFLNLLKKGTRNKIDQYINKINFIIFIKNIDIIIK